MKFYFIYVKFYYILRGLLLKFLMIVKHCRAHVTLNKNYIATHDSKRKRKTCFLVWQETVITEGKQILPRRASGHPVLGRFTTDRFYGTEKTIPIRVLVTITSPNSTSVFVDLCNNHAKMFRWIIFIHKSFVILLSNRKCFSPIQNLIISQLRNGYHDAQITVYVIVALQT